MGQIAAIKPDASERGFGKLCPPQRGLLKVGVVERGRAPGRIIGHRAVCNGTGEICFFARSQVGEQSATHHDARRVGAAKISPFELGIGKISPFHVCTGKIGSFERGIHKRRFREHGL